MAQRAESAADVTRLAAAFARAMTVGLRSWGFYLPEHPAVAMAVERLTLAATDACVGGKSIVRSIVMGDSTFTAAEQERLLEISRDVGAIGELCKDAKEPFCMPDGSPMLTTQATVLAVYRHIAKTVTALEPGRVKEAIDSLALAAGGLEPSTALELLLQEEQADEGIPIVSALKQSFDGHQVALLLGRALSPGHATNRLARVLDTLAPDDQRKERVLTLAKKLISERDFGSKRPIDDIRKTLDELLLQYDETTYVSKDYRESIEVAASRAADLASRGLPEEMPEWLETRGSNSVRKLSGQPLIDLLRNETVAGRMAETARDMSAFVEELLLSGAYPDPFRPQVKLITDTKGESSRHHSSPIRGIVMPVANFPAPSWKRSMALRRALTR